MYSIAVVCILVVATINMLNICFTMAIQVISLVAKVLALIVIVIGRLLTLVQSGLESLGNLDIPFQGTKLGLSPIGMAGYQGFWSFLGWSNLNFVTEKPEVRNKILCVEDLFIQYT